PVVSETSKAVLADDCFDLPLAQKLTGQKTPVVTNSFQLSGKERIFIVSGPNQGGKTTFARTFGQLHYLASLGLPVPGKKAELFLPDRIFTHFEKEESPDSLRGKLEDDLFRIHAI
ncbi:DNA mismatch repair protein MutS, partial [Brucella sp. 10RB9210]|nr:DNA mismatch repair protein MutS [Brucella sp. 10RB9210]